MVSPLRPGLRGEYFIHPLDRAGMQDLLNRLTAALSWAQIHRFIREAEEEFFLINLADNTRLTETQGGSLYRLVSDVAGTLGMPTPHVFLDTSINLAPKTLGGDRAGIVLPSAVVDRLAERPLRAVIGHELGHILCGHSFYRLLAENFEHLTRLTSAIPVVGPLLSVGMQLVLYDWYRKSDYSADRAALLATQDLDDVIESLRWFAGGATSLGSELSNAGFAEQAAEYQRAVEQKRSGGVFDRAGYLLSGMVVQHALSPHPWPALRLHEISQWAASDAYRRLLAGDYPESSATPAGEGQQSAGPLGTVAAAGVSVAGLVVSTGKSTLGALKGLWDRGQTTSPEESRATPASPDPVVERAPPRDAPL